MDNILVSYNRILSLLQISEYVLGKLAVRYLEVALVTAWLGKVEQVLMVMQACMQLFEKDERKKWELGHSLQTKGKRWCWSWNEASILQHI